MNFRNHRRREEPEINLIPLIDVLLVILIFLMASTSFGKQGGLKINLPKSDGEQSAQDLPDTLNIYINAKGVMSINETPLEATDALTLTQSLRDMATHMKNKDPLIVIHADADVAHQKVITVMESALNAGLTKLTFATQLEKTGPPLK